MRQKGAPTTRTPVNLIGSEQVAHRVGDIVVQERAERAQQIVAKDRVEHQPVGTNQHSEGVDNKNKGINTLNRPTGTSAAAALRRLRTETEKGNDTVAPIYERVLSGEITPNAGMVEAGTAALT